MMRWMRAHVVETVLGLVLTIVVGFFVIAEMSEASDKRACHAHGGAWQCTQDGYLYVNTGTVMIPVPNEHCSCTK